MIIIEWMDTLATVHFSKGETVESAFRNLLEITEDEDCVIPYKNDCIFWRANRFDPKPLKLDNELKN